jgi:alanyl-tRNA synthetase
MFGILLDKTNFYAESGGQENDTGSLSIDGKADFEVTDVQVFNGYVLHVGYMKEGEVRVGDEVVCTYSEVSSGIQQIPSGASRDTGINRMIRMCRNDDGL